MIAEGPTADEVAKAQNSEEADLIKGLQSAHGKAEFLHSNNFFDGDPLALVNHLLRAGEIELGELDDLRKQVAEAEKKQKKERS